MEEVPSCLLCGSSDGKLVVVQRHAIDSLITSSRNRKDNRFKTFQKISEAHVHDNCRMSYNIPSSIATAAKDKSTKISDGKKVAKEALHFDFQKFCFFFAVKLVTGTMIFVPLKRMKQS